MAGWTSILNLIKEELIQRRDEGCVIPEHLENAILACHPTLDAWNTEKIDPLYDALMKLEPDPKLAAQEPNELAAIRALRPDGPRDLKWQPSESELIDRLHGAWLGRASGCALGKPVESGRFGMARENDKNVGRKRIKEYLQKRNDWPLRDYFSSRDVGDGIALRPNQSCRELIAYMEPDDDIHYSIVGMGVLESTGPAFTWQDVGKYWLSHLPISAICTAETQAIINLLNRTNRGWDGHATPAFTRRYRNPYREWIGAQIRSDGWAWCCAGKPELAAEYAYRDACWTHERNGIYGEMMFAAIQAAAFVESNPEKLIQIGLSEIPRDCRLARYVRQCMGWIKESRDWESCADKMDAVPELLTMNAVHTINNALICQIALAYGKMDTVEAPAIAVMGALDTDCNGATVGSIVGAAAGKSRFKMDLAGRLNDTIKPAMLGFQEVTMRELAERTAKVWKKVDEYHRERK